METERWLRIQELFHHAVDLESAERTRFLERECASDADLRREIERLLEVDSESDDAFSRIDARPTRSTEDPLIGQSLGAYTVTERLGAGGMGVVYRGERADGLFQQEVAIKLIRSERATDWMLRRFEFERRTLAGLQHPGIARVFDAGTTAQGSPYFVMEFVRGETLDRYCESRCLEVDARLRLFVQVCRAVHYAHQSLVVHCDLKPANILVDDHGTPRLLDFGIARLLEDDPADATSARATRTLARVLTPEYASPEQLAGGAVTTSIDVYSLGVVLYELLSGRRPFEHASRSPADWERLVRERAPERPSTRVRHVEDGSPTTTVGASFGTTPSGLRRALRGDLDRIVLMALRKEPERRYASACEFADDVERFLAGHPVHAQVDSVPYRTWKFVRRNRIAVAGAALVFAALTIGLVAARRSERLAELEAENARRSEQTAAMEAQHARIEAESFQNVADFLMDAFLPTQPLQDAAWQSRARERIRAHAERVNRQYVGQDHVRANLLDTLGQVCMRLDLLDDARTLLEESAGIRLATFGSTSLEFALSLRSRGQLAFQMGDFPRAEELLRDALLIQRASAGDAQSDVAGAANDLATCLRNLGRTDEARELHMEALSLRREPCGDTLPVAESLNNLASVHEDLGEHEIAVAELREALAIRTDILGRDHPLSIQSTSNLGTVLWSSGARDEAIATMRTAEKGYRALGGDGEDNLGLTLSNLAWMHLLQNDFGAAAPLLEEALTLQKRRLGDLHPAVAVTTAKLAVLNHARKQDEEARRLWVEVVRIRRAAPLQRRELAEALYSYGTFLHDLREYDTSITYLEEALGLHREHDLGDHAAWGRVVYVLGLCAEAIGNREHARDHYREALQLFEDAPQTTEEERTRVSLRLARLERKMPR